MNEVQNNEKNNKVIKIVMILLLCIAFAVGGFFLSKKLFSSTEKEKIKEDIIEIEAGKYKYQNVKYSFDKKTIKAIGDFIGYFCEVGKECLSDASRKLRLVDYYLTDEASIYESDGTEPFPYVTLSKYKEAYKKLYGSLDDFDKIVSKGKGPDFYYASENDPSLSKDLVAWNDNVGAHEYTYLESELLDGTYLNLGNNLYSYEGRINYHYSDKKDVTDQYQIKFKVNNGKIGLVSIVRSHNIHALDKKTINAIGDFIGYFCEVGKECLSDASRKLRLVDYYLTDEASIYESDGTEPFPYVTLSKYKEAYKKLYGSLDDFDKIVSEGKGPDFYYANENVSTLSKDLVAWNNNVGAHDYIDIKLLNGTYTDLKNNLYRYEGNIYYRYSDGFVIYGVYKIEYKIVNNNISLISIVKNYDKHALDNKVINTIGNFIGDCEKGKECLSDASRKLRLVDYYLTDEASWYESDNIQPFPYVTLTKYKEAYKKLYGSLDDFDKVVSEGKGPDFYYANENVPSLSKDLVAWNNTGDHEYIDIKLLNGTYTDLGNNLYRYEGNISYYYIDHDDTSEKYKIEYKFNNGNIGITSIIKK